ncbi:MAG: flagellar basal-body rod protein FlgG [Spirochaetes bacterium]|jgi:flagellar basal-body rod protein FlgG|nr:flagellar basal-body rod protein FlgG [Spirochaetota bacterium]NLJ04883.1 flagellar basal-body rod protein FlgG [Exilispira sp.]MBP8990588.1 flagellar basal-body rod protein FlgG [Spirochaetota bacterium]HOV45760.1 flagellar basal-body rod protein FlgG [Exilispira sp.]HQM88602.1 flagellar basal-body rod protein FlgG [Exilispira sp.]
MINSLWIGAVGMSAQQTNIDIISNNLANVNTSGFKKSRAEFEDLLYQKVRMAGTPIMDETISPVPIQIGYGAKVAATQKIFAQGALQHTEVRTDIAIMGDGFFRVQMYDGSFGYTRDGSFKVDSNGQIVTSEGYRLVPEVILPDGFVYDEINITPDGRIFAKVAGNDTPIPVGQIQLFRFTNNAGLEAAGENLFKETQASGYAIPGTPGSAGFGSVHQGYLEMSNVNTVESMVNLIVAQRAYEFNSKSITTADSLLQTAIGMKR